MKKITLTLVLAVAVLSSFSQVKDTSVTESYVNGSWQITNRSISTYNASCDLINVVVQNWDNFASSWVNAFQSNYVYSTGPDKTIIIGQAWSTGTNSWDNNSKATQTYSADHSLLISITQTWDLMSQAWLNLFKVRTTLNEAGNVVLDEFDMFTDNQWQPSTKTSLEYDNTNRPVIVISKVWNGLTWANSGKRTSSYSGKGEGFGFYWSDFDQKWVKSDRNFNDYVANTLYTEKSLGQFLNGDTWVNSSRTANSYTTDLKQIGSNLEIWDAGSSSWTKIYRGKQDYYSNGQPSVYVLQLWDASLAAWVSNYRLTQTNHICPVTVNFSAVVTQGNSGDLSALSSVRSIRGFNQKAVSNSAISFNHFESGGDAMVYDVNVPGKNSSSGYSFKIIQTIKKTAAIANADASGAQQTSASSFVISPNPAKHYFNININSHNPSTLTLHDLSGRLVLQQKMQSAGVQKVNLPSLQKGVYIVTVTTGREILKQKLVIE